MGRGAWQATVHRVAKSQIQPMSNCSLIPEILYGECYPRQIVLVLALDSELVRMLNSCVWAETAPTPSNLWRQFPGGTVQRVRHDWATNQQLYNRGKGSSSQFGHWPLSLDLRWGFRKWEWSRRKEGSRWRSGLCEAVTASAQNSPPPLRTASWPHWDSIPGCLWPWCTSLELQKWFSSWYWDGHLLFFDKFFLITKRKGEKSTYSPWFSPQLFSSHFCVPKKLIFVLQNPVPQNKKPLPTSKAVFKGKLFHK